MARNGIFRRPQVSAAALRDPVAMIDHGVAILTLMLFLFLLGGVTFAAAAGSPQQCRAWTPDVSRCCDEVIRDPDSITAPGKG